MDPLGEPHRTLVSRIAATGLRIWESLALRWMALDLESGTLTVRESVFEGTFQPPKTQTAMRTMPLERTTRTADEGLVFGRPTGEPFGSRRC